MRLQMRATPRPHAAQGIPRVAPTVRRSAPDTEVNRTTLTIYISSLGDVKDERLGLVKGLERLSMEPFARDKATSGS